MNDLDPTTACSPDEMAAYLRKLYVRADEPSLRELEHRTVLKTGLLPGTNLKRVRLGRTTLSVVLAGRRFPKKAFLLTLVEALGVDLETDHRWERAWDRLAEAAKARAETARAEAERATAASDARGAALLSDLAPAPSVTTPAPPGAEGVAGPVAERRVCSVLFCDVVGFAPPSESRDPEAVRELLSRYLEDARTVIGRYGGVVGKVIGAAVMAVWGTSVAAPEDAERAVRAGLDLVARVGELEAEATAPSLAARAGVVTGEVAVTLGAVGEGMVAGDAVKTAARVQAAAQRGQVLADGTTRRRAESAIRFVSAGEHPLKGNAEPQPLWRATRVLSGVGGAQRVDGLEAPLIGRDLELRMIRELFHSAADRQMPQLVLVSGPAGVGKSRLGWEFRKYIDGLAETVRWHRGRCLSYGDGERRVHDDDPGTDPLGKVLGAPQPIPRLEVAFWALAEIVRQRLGIAENDPAEKAAGKLADGLDQFVPDPKERKYIGARLSRLLGVVFAEDSGTGLTQQELFAGWRLFFERLADVHPVVLLVEDAQHADPGLLDFLDHLIDWTRDLPVYVLVFARPELGQARPGFGEGRNRGKVTLPPLNAASMDRLVDALVPGMPATARAKITSQAQGIPLFAVETVRALVDQGIVRPAEGGYRLTGDIGELAVPDSLQKLLADRLNALDPGVRQLVTDAAVLGARFPAEALIAVSGRDEIAVRAALGELVRREVFSVSADPLSPEQGRYQFTHSILRQVAYRTLSRRDRKARHLAVAAHLRAADGEEVADVVARHYLDAMEAVPDDPDVGQIQGQAIKALIRAAERAIRTGTPALAAASYATAAELTALDIREKKDAAGRRPSAGALWECAARAAVRNADWAVAIQYADRAGDLYRQCGDARAAARTQAVAGQALRMWGQHDQAREQLTAALKVLQAANPDTDMVQALGELANLEARCGSPDAGAHSEQALTLGQELAVDYATLADLFTTRGIYLGYKGRRLPHQAAAYHREAARLAALAEDTVGQSGALASLSDAITGTDPPPAGAEAAREAAVLARQAGARSNLAMAVANLAQALLMTGEWDDAEAELTQAIAVDGLADVKFLACCLAWLAALRGDTDAAQEALDELGDLRDSQDPQDKANIAVAEAFTAAARQPALALHHARAVLDHSAALGIGNEYVRWAWPLAARAAHDLADTGAAAELLAMLDRAPGQLVPMLRAEHDLACARLAARDGKREADAAFVGAIASLRQQSTPYHIAHGLLDYAEYLGHRHDDEAAEAKIVEAREIGGRLRCQPLLDRAADISPADGGALPRV